MVEDLGPADSVYDFLYVDSRRLGLLLSQFGTDGVLTELSRTADEAAETGGGVSIKIARLEQKNTGKSGLIRRFDPRWLVPLTFLDQAEGWIQRNLSKATLGQIILLKVGVGISDVSFMKKLWEAPWVQRAIADSIPQDDTQQPSAQNRSARRRDERGAKKPPNEQIDLTAMVGTIMGMMPHAVQSTFATGDGHILWGTLTDEYLIGSAADLLLKHGTSIAGEWYVVAVIDALPDGLQFDELRARVELERESSQMSMIMQHFKPMLQLGFSRPAHAYGVTPLIIMREIKSLWENET